MNEYSDLITRVRYAETDQMGVVYYANYYIYFEIARVEYMRERGVSYKEMETEDDSFIVVAESKCTYKRPAHYDDLLRIRTRVTQMRRRTIRFAYEVFNDANSELLATGETFHVVCNREGRPKAMGDRYIKMFAEQFAEAGVENPESEI